MASAIGSGSSELRSPGTSRVRHFGSVFSDSRLLTRIQSALTLSLRVSWPVTSHAEPLVRCASCWNTACNDNCARNRYGDSPARQSYTVVIAGTALNTAISPYSTASRIRLGTGSARTPNADRKFDVRQHRSPFRTIKALTQPRGTWQDDVGDLIGDRGLSQLRDTFSPCSPYIPPCSPFQPYPGLFPIVC